MTANAQRALEESAQRIAAKGREVLLERLRGAFEEAAAAHADVLALDDEKLEGMIEDAAERADGLQWRRALASVATEELGIGLAEALGHPAVARAQVIVGAPSYEEGLAAIAEGKAPKAGTGEARTEEADGEAPAGESAEDEGEDEAEDAGEDGYAVDGGSEGLRVSVGVVHLDGLPELEGQGELELVFSASGLKIIHAGEDGGGAALVSFTWSELRDVEVEPGRGRVRRRRASRVVLSTNRRRARFDARGVGLEELKERLAPALAKIGTEE
ncbi:MAG TPA: hypothetical protein VG294_08020 [Solirubrobacteraceae bacterium]|nr:hypothetical protein [Solirubrobacteraceae bacterium]